MEKKEKRRKRGKADKMGNNDEKGGKIKILGGGGNGEKREGR